MEFSLEDALELTGRKSVERRRLDHGSRRRGYLTRLRDGGRSSEGVPIEE